MTTIAKTTLLALVLLAGSMQLTQAATPYTTDLSTLPAKVAQAARAAQPGIVLKKHRLLWTSDEGEYLIVGVLYGQFYRFKITSSGRVVSVTELDTGNPSSNS